MLYGYGILLSDIPLTKKRKTTTKAYIALNKYILDEIVIEAIPNLDSARLDLEFLIDSLSPGDVIVFSSLESIAGNALNVYNILYKLSCHAVDWAILGEPDLSSYNIDSYESYYYSDAKIDAILNDVQLANIGRTTGRKAIQLSENFIDVFWDWQNYFISTEEACQILKMGTATFYSKASEFIRLPCYKKKYITGHDERMVDWQKKPMRGPKIKDSKYLEALRDLKRIFGSYDNWDLDEVSAYLATCHEEVLDLIPQDIMRLYLNYSQTAATTRAAKQFYNPEVLKKYE